MLELATKWAVPFILTGFTTYVLKWLKKVNTTISTLPTSNENLLLQITTIENKVRENNENIIKLKELTIDNDLAILWSQLTGKCTKIIEQEHCDVSTKECIEQLFARYEAIGGNHGMNAMVKQAVSYCKKK